MAEFSCAQCGDRLRTGKAAETYICPVCDCGNVCCPRKSKRMVLPALSNTRATMRLSCGNTPLKTSTWDPNSLFTRAKRPFSSGTAKPWICLALDAILWRPSSFPYWKSSINFPPIPREPSIPKSTTSTKRFNMQTAVEISDSRASTQSPTTQQRTIGSSQETVKLIGTNLIAENEPDTNPEPPNQVAPSKEEQEVSSVPISDNESELTTVSTQPPESQPDLLGRFP